MVTKPETEVELPVSQCCVRLI